MSLVTTQLLMGGYMYWVYAWYCFTWNIFNIV